MACVPSSGTLFTLISAEAVLYMSKSVSFEDDVWDCYVNVTRHVWVGSGLFRKCPGATFAYFRNVYTRLVLPSCRVRLIHVLSSIADDSDSMNSGRSKSGTSAFRADACFVRV